MSILLNLIWLFLGGAAAAMTWFIIGIIMLLTIVGIPWAKACFNIAILTFWPFGSSITKTNSSASMKSAGLVGNIIWFILAGWWLALGHLCWGILLAVTIIGIPFALQHFKLARISLSPVGKTIVLDL